MITEDKPNRGSRGSKVLLVSASILTVILCVLGLAYSQTDLGNAASKYDQNKKAAEQAGLLFDSNQVAALYEVPADQNSASIIKPLLEIPRKNKWDNEKKLTEALINEHRDEFLSAVGQLESATSRPYMVFPRNLSNPAAILYPEYSELKTWVKVLCFMAQTTREKGDDVSAGRYLKIAAYLSRVTDDEGTIIANLVRCAQCAIIERELKATLEARGRDPKWQAVVKQTLAAMDKPYDVRKSLKIEHWFATYAAHEIVRNPAAFATDTGFSSTPTPLKYAKYIPRFEKASLSRVHESYAATMAKMPSDPYNFAQMRSALNDLDQTVSMNKLSYVVLNMVAPVFSQFTKALERETCNRSVIEQSLTILSGNLDPAKGLPLNDRRAKDLDGKPLRIKNVNGHWIIYSIGQDLVDDGGKEEKNQKGDWVIHLPK